jgi:hypothetical protein
MSEPDRREPDASRPGPVTTRRCTGCKKFKPDTRYDRDLDRDLCNKCWMETPPRHYP